MTHYGGVIWTNHALERMRERGLRQDVARQVFKHPDQTQKGKQAETTEFIKKVGESTITLIGKQSAKQEWVIVSAWLDPPIPGTRDFREQQKWHAYKRRGFWGKLFFTFRKQLGL